MKEQKTKIYVLKDPDTLEVRYVGKTVATLSKRLNNHISRTRCNPTTHTANWIKSLLSQNKRPIIELIEICEGDKWVEREKFWIKQFNTLCNHTEGGEGSVGYKHTPENIAKMIKNRKPYKHTLESKERVSKFFKGKPCTCKEKISIANKGKKRSEEVRKRISESQKGRKITPEAAKKISIALTGKKRPIEVKLKISKSNKGKIRSEETKEKLRQLNIGKKHPMETRIKNSKGKIIQYTLDNNIIKEWFTLGQIQEELGFRKGNIVQVCNYKRKTAYGYKWRYNNKNEDIV